MPATTATYTDKLDAAQREGLGRYIELAMTYDADRLRDEYRTWKQVFDGIDMNDGNPADLERARNLAGAVLESVQVLGKALADGARNTLPLSESTQAMINTSRPARTEGERVMRNQARVVDSRTSAGVHANRNDNALERVKAARALLPALDTAYYAVEHQGTLKFYKVDKPQSGRWAGYTFVKVQASDDLYPVKNLGYQAEVLEAIAKDPKAAMLRYGKEIGSCGHCHRTLTNEESRAYGIGPVCRGKMGW
jgi:hypothetical protein